MHHTDYPHIIEAFLYLEGVNGGVNRRNTQARVTARIIRFLDCQGNKVQQALPAINGWIGSLSEEERAIFLDGDEDDIEKIGKTGPAYAERLFADYFDWFEE